MECGVWSRPDAGWIDGPRPASRAGAYKELYVENPANMFANKKALESMLFQVLPDGFVDERLVFCS